MVVAALVPMLLSAPGQVSADSRQYLYLDPGAFLARATSLWDPSVAAGTVPHQHLGFLWPMGPWFWLVDLVGVPTWIGQRLWLAAVVAAAGLGAHRLARALGCGPAAALVAALAYQLTPYQLAFTARFSVLLLPWAALPWLVHLTRRSLAERSWHAPLAFGLVASTAGSVNASSLLLVMLGPVIVLVAATLSRPAIHAISAGARIAVCTTVASAWWLAGVFVQGRYGLPVLQLTENVDTVAAASTPDDVIRGLGNWIFVSTDGATTAIDQAAAYAESTPVRLATVALPAIALAVLAGVRIRGRGAIAAAMALATVIAVGPAPLGDPSAYGRLWRTISDSSSVGLALRNTPRIVPVLVLAVALALALAIDRLRGRVRVVGAAAVLVVVVLAIAPVARHGFLDSDFTRPEQLPERWSAVAADLDTIEGTGDDPGSRVLELPGANFAAYSWGNTVEPVLAGLVSRPTIAREVLPAGGFGTVNLLGALDRSILNGTFEPRSLAPVARLLGVGDIVIRGDLDTSRFGLPSAASLVARLDQDPPPGFRVRGRYGTDATGRPLLLRLTLDAPTTLLRADAVAPVLLAGDGAGIVDAAATGLIDGNRTILPAVTVGDVALDDALDRGAEVIVTDTNRKAATTFFYTIADDVGAAETADAVEPDPTGYDVRLGPYADADATSKTVAVHLGGSVSATTGGGPERPEHRPVHAFDGDSSTAWRPRAAPIGQAVSARFADPVSTDHITVRSTPAPARVRAIRVTIDGGPPFDVQLTADAMGEPGQRIDLAPTSSVREIRIELIDVDGGPGSAPGLVDVSVGDAVIDETLRLPSDLIASVGDRVAGRRVTYVLSRMLGDAADPERQAVENDLDRLLTVAAPDVYSVSGSALGPPTGCRDDLLTIDGAPVSVEITASGDLQGCATVSLEPGEHRVRAPNEVAEINRLVLTAGPPPAPGPTITPRDTELGARSARATMDAVGPFWFTLAQSRNDGWSISVEGGAVVSTAMTDGYANGWLIEPSGEGPVTVDLVWTPQRFVWAGFAITALLVPASIVVFGRRPRRRGADETAADDWQASSLRPDDDLRRRLAVVALGVAWAATWWFVGGALVSALAVAALVARLAAPHAQLPLAAGAAVAVVAAEFSDRPSLVFVGLSFALAEIVAARAAGDQEPMLAWNE